MWRVQYSTAQYSTVQLVAADKTLEVWKWKKKRRKRRKRRRKRNLPSEDPRSSRKGVGKNTL